MEVRTPEGRKRSFCDVRIREMDGLESKITWKFALAMFVPHGNYQSTSGWVVQMIFVNEHAESGWHCKTSDLVVSLKHLGAFKDPVVLWQIGLWVSRQHKIGSPLPWKKVSIVEKQKSEFYFSSESNLLFFDNRHTCMEDQKLSIFYRGWILYQSENLAKTKRVLRKKTNKRIVSLNWLWFHFYRSENLAKM